MILARAFFLLWRAFVNFWRIGKEEHLLIDREIAKKSTASFQHVQKHLRRDCKRVNFYCNGYFQNV
jgi:hypothetical protein